MSSLCFLLVAAATAVQFGWQPADNGGREYIIQVEPQLIDTFRKEGFSSDVPPQLRDIRRIRVVVGTGPVPHEGEMTPHDGEMTPSAAAKVTTTLKAADSAGSRLAGIGDKEDPIPEAFVPKLSAPKNVASKTAASKTAEANSAGSKTAAMPKVGPKVGPKTTIAAKILSPDDPLPLPGPAVDRPDPNEDQTGPAMVQIPPPQPTQPPAGRPTDSGPSFGKIDRPEGPAAKTDQPTANDKPARQPTVAGNEIHAPPLISADAKTIAMPVPDSVRPALATNEFPVANNKSWAADKPAVIDSSDPPPDPTPDNRSGSRWGNGGRSASDGSAPSSDPFAQKAHASPSEQPIGVGLSAEVPRPWFALFSAGALLAVSVAANVYLGWLYWTARVRYLELVEELHGQPHAIEEPAAAHT